MTYQQPKLLTPPPRNTNLQQANQVLEELAVQLHLLAARSLTLADTCAGFTQFSLPLGSSLLFGDGIADAVY
jgi:hypothetical protein